jgi:8-oxo-dGTP diphosphatase
LRPLNKSGWRQADALAESFEKEPIDRVLSSPYVRCVQTVEPLARARGVPVETTKELEEGAGAESAIRLIKQQSGKQIVLCTHGDLVEELLEGLIAQGILPRARANAEKGSTWVLEEHDGRITAAKYRAAP